MLVFTSVLALLAFSQVFVQLARESFVKSIKIDPESVANFNAEAYLKIHKVVAFWNNEWPDDGIRIRLLENIGNIEHYYKDHVNEPVNFGAIKVLPYMIEMLGKDFPDDTDSLWISIVIFFDILKSLTTENIKVHNDEIVASLHFFRDHCAEYGIKGLSNRVFHRLYPDIGRQDNIMSMFISVAGANQADALGIYLKQCDTFEQGQLDFVYKMIQKNQYRFGSQVFAHVCAEIAHEKITSTSTSAADMALYSKLFMLLHFASTRQLLSKTEFLLVKSALLIHSYS